MDCGRCANIVAFLEAEKGIRDELWSMMYVWVRVMSQGIGESGLKRLKMAYFGIWHIFAYSFMVCH